MDDTYRILEELTIGDKKRRFEELNKKFLTMDHDDADLINVMEEMTKLQRECSQFMFDQHDQMIEDALSKRDERQGS